MASAGLQFDVLVVGGGISGLACAHKLFQCGYSVALVEARWKLGGRTSSIKISNGTSRGPPLRFNIGAAWIHCSNDNPLVPLIKKHNIPTKENSGQVGMLDHLYFPNAPELTSDERTAVEKIMQKLQIEFERIQLDLQERGKDRSVADVLEQIFRHEEALSDQFHGNGRISGTVRWLMSQLAQYEGSSLKNISALHSSLEFGRDEVVEERQGPDRIVLTYEELINSMASQLPANSFFLNDPVISIDYQNHPIVRTQSGRLLQARRVVVTAPLGVLKSNKIQFLPPLSARKQTAIQRIGYGIMNKIVLHFEDCFWDPDCHSFGIISEPVQFPYWLNQYRICGKPVLIGLYAGQFPLQIQEEGWSDERIRDTALTALANSFSIVLPGLVDWFITHWEKEEWILGSYSYSHFLSSTEDFDIVAEPVEGKIFFAGEHTNKEEHGYVHGAFSSGVSVATQIHELDTKTKPLARL